MRVMVCGDILIQGPTGLSQPQLAKLSRALRPDSDVVLTANLELPLTNSGYPADKAFALRCLPDDAGWIREIGFSVLSLANNHMLDFGPEGLFCTLNTLGRWGIPAVGAGSCLLSALLPARVRVKDEVLAVLAFSCTLPPGFAAGPDRPGVAPIRIQQAYRLDASSSEEQPGTGPFVATWPHERDLEQAASAVSAASKEADAVLVHVHWGVPPGYRPAAHGALVCYQRSVADRLMAAGATVIAGHHPHVLHPVEQSGKGVVLWSLGNLFFHPDRPGVTCWARDDGPSQIDWTQTGFFQSAAYMVEISRGKVRGLWRQNLSLDDQGDPRPVGQLLPV